MELERFSFGVRFQIFQIAFFASKFGQYDWFLYDVEFSKASRNFPIIDKTPGYFQIYFQSWKIFISSYDSTLKLHGKQLRMLTRQVCHALQ